MINYNEQDHTTMLSTLLPTPAMMTLRTGSLDRHAYLHNSILASPDDKMGNERSIGSADSPAPFLTVHSEEDSNSVEVAGGN